MTVTRLPGTEGMRPVVQPDVLPDLDVAVKHDKGKLCVHKHIEVTVERRVLCHDCNVWIDPVDYIIGLARDWARYRNSYRTNVAEARAAYERLERLKREEANTKNRLRAALKRGMESGVLSEDESREIRRRAGMSFF